MRPFPPPPPAFASFSSASTSPDTKAPATGAGTGETSASRVKRPTSAFDDLFSDILDALASSGLDSDAPADNTHRPRTVVVPAAPVQVHSDLKKLKHSISERNLQQTQRYQHDLESIDKLLLSHRREQAEHARVRAELAAERELSKRLLREGENAEIRHAVEMEAANKANRRALQVLMGLQRDEFLSWARGELEPHLELIEIGVRRRIANWERGKRDTMLRKRDSNIPKPPSTPTLIPKREMDRERARDTRIGIAISKDSSPDEKAPVSVLVRRRSSNGGTSWVTRRRTNAAVKIKEDRRESRHPFATTGRTL